MEEQRKERRQDIASGESRSQCRSGNEGIDLNLLLGPKFTSKASIFGGGFNTIDKLFLWGAISRSLAFMLLHGKMDAVVNQFAFMWDSLGATSFSALQSAVKRT
jgi:hypothetical protein